MKALRIRFVALFVVSAALFGCIALPQPESLNGSTTLVMGEGQQKSFAIQLYGGPREFGIALDVIGRSWVAIRIDNRNTQIALGETQLIDLDGDGTADISLRLEEIRRERKEAVITVQYLPPLPTPEPTPSRTLMPVGTHTPAATPSPAASPTPLVTPTASPPPTTTPTPPASPTPTPPSPTPTPVPSPTPTPSCPDSYCANGVLYSSCYYDAAAGRCACFTRVTCPTLGCAENGTACLPPSPTATPVTSPTPTPATGPVEISGCPFAISAGGQYALAGPVNASGDCITISARDAVLDCRGNAITGDGSGWGITLQDASGVTVRNCVVRGFRQGVRLNSSSGNVLENNSVASAGEAGLYLYYSSSNNLTGNSVSGGGNGIHLRYSDGNRLLNNSATETMTGILLEQSNGNFLSGNSANNGGDGIRIVGPGSNTLANNRACGNALENIRCDSVQEDGGGNTCSPEGANTWCGVACGAGC